MNLHWRNSSVDGDWTLRDFTDIHQWEYTKYPTEAERGASSEWYTIEYHTLKTSTRYHQYTVVNRGRKQEYDINYPPIVAGPFKTLKAAKLAMLVLVQTIA